MFEEPLLLVNMLIKAYMKTPENREYLRLAFSKIWVKTVDMNRYLEELKCKQKDSMLKIQRHGSVRVAPAMTEREPHPRSNSGDEESKTQSKELTMEDYMLICDQILKSIKETLYFMPVSVRYLCKLIADIIKSYVNLYVLIEYRTQIR